MAPKGTAGTGASPKRSTSARPTPGSPARSPAQVPGSPARRQGASEISEILSGEFPECAKNFVLQYRGITQQALHSTDLGAASRLGQATQHLNAVSWRRGMSEKHTAELESLLMEVLPTMQALLGVAASFNARAALARGVSPAEVVHAIRVGLEVSALYCELASIYDAPATLLVEEVNVGVVQCFKLAIKQLVFPLLSSMEAQKNMDPLPFGKEETAQICQIVSGTMGSMHQLLCRHKFPDDQLHQLVYICVHIFFLVDVDFRLCAAAEELLVTIFCRHPDMQSSVIQEFLVGVTKIATGKYAKKFLLPVPQDSADHGLSTWTHLLLRLVQSSCLPLRESLGAAKVDFDMVMQGRAPGQAVLNQLSGGLVNRLLLTRSRDDDLRNICAEITEELLGACLKPSWPGALALLRTLFYQLVGLVQQGKKKDAADASAREFSLKIVTKIICHLTHHQVEAEKDAIRLPSWSLPQSKVNKDYRMLQHVALRVSLEDDRKLPWTKAAKAVQAWDAELYLKNDDGGLSNFTDDVVFRYLIKTHLEDERLVEAKCPPKSAGHPTLSSAVFGAAHPIHTWSFLVCDWADAAAKSKKALEKEAEHGEVDLETENRQRVLERLLAVSWTSPSMLAGEGGTARSGGGRRVLLPFIAHKVFRQLQCGAPIHGILKLGIDCMVMQANSPQATIRKTAVKALGELIEIDSRLLTQRAVEETLDMRIRDESAWVRQSALDLLGRLLDTAEEGEDAPLTANGDDTNSKILLRFAQTVRSRINDTSLVVRRQASKILGAFVLTHPDHQDVVPVVLDLLHRSTDSEKLRDMVLQTFEALWFVDDEPGAAAAMQLARVVAAANTANTEPAKLLSELLERYKKSLSTKKRSKGYEDAMRRWTTLLLREFVRLTGTKAPDVVVQEELMVQRKALLSTLEAFAEVQPKEMLLQMRPLTVYLCLEEKATADEQWVAQKVCRIISAVLPCPVDKRGVFAHTSVQNDLQLMIKSQPSTGVREAVRCLCLVVKYMTGDLAQVVKHIAEAIPALNHYCDLSTSHPDKVDRIALLYMSRLIWVTCSILETLPIDTYMEPQGTRLKRDVFPFQFVDGSLAKTVLVTLSKLYAVPNNALKAVVVQCLGFFLCGHRGFMKERSVRQTLASSLTSPDMTIRLRALETMSRLLGHYGREAEKETKPIEKTVKESATASAVESAQPLALHAPEVLVHITVAKSEIGRLIVHRGSQDDETLLKIRIEALTVLRYLHQQGLVNPMTIMSKVFALAFSVELPVAEPASLLLKDMLDMRPTILLNRLDEALHDTFLAALAGSQPPALGETLHTPFATFCELYADIFRRNKGTREALIRKLLQQVLRLSATRFSDFFSDLLECSEHPAMLFKKRRLLIKTDSDINTGMFTSSMVSKLPALQYYQLLYAQFVASVLTALPFTFESEPLLVIYECNRHLSLAGGPLSTASGAGISDVDGLVELIKDRSKDHFSEAVSVVTCLVLKSIMKSEYNLNAEQCAQFNPKEVKQEKIKSGFFNLARREDGGKAGEDAAATSRMPVFPVADWSKLASPLATKYDKPAEIAKLVQEAMDSDPWDSSFSRYAEKLDQLEGKPPKKKEPKTPKVSTPPGRAGRASAAVGRGRGGRGRPPKRRKVEVAAKEDSDDDDEMGDDTEDDDFVP